MRSGGEFPPMATCCDNLPDHRRVLGSAAVIANLRSQQMKDFHSHWYQLFSTYSNMLSKTLQIAAQNILIPMLMALLS